MKTQDKPMKDISEAAVRKRAQEQLRGVISSLKTVGDHGTAAQLQPILNRMVERRKISVAQRK